MHCPRDNSELIITSHKKVHAYSCEHCLGLMLRPSSLLVLQDNFSKPIVESYFKSLHDKEPSILCPNCSDTMKIVKMGEVEIDLCPSCQSGWFDNNEIKTIIKTHGEKLKTKGLNRVEDSVIGESFLHFFADIICSLLIF